MGKTKTAFLDGTSQEENKKVRKQKVQDKSEVHVSGLKGGQRVVAISAEPVIEEKAEEKVSKKEKKVKVRSKKYQEAKSKVDRNKFYSVKDAIKLVKETSYSKFNGSVEAHLVVKKVGLSANFALPFSAGKEKKIVFVDDAVLENLKSGKINFDVLLATPDMMPKLVPFARLLGPRGLMPNPKNGTLIKDKKDAANFSGNNVNVKTEKEAPNIHTVVGKVDQKEEELIENLNALLNALTTKQIVKAYIKATMGPSVKIRL